MEWRMNSEKWVFRARHSDSTIASSDGLMRNPLISVVPPFRFVQRGILLLLDVARLVTSAVFVFIELLDGVGPEFGKSQSRANERRQSGGL
jgi:hypothetical protein